MKYDELKQNLLGRIENPFYVLEGSWIDYIHNLYSADNFEVDQLGPLVEKIEGRELLDKYPNIRSDFGLQKINPDKYYFICLEEDTNKHVAIECLTSHCDDITFKGFVPSGPSLADILILLKKYHDDDYFAADTDDSLIDLTYDGDVADIIEYMLDILCYEQGCDDIRTNDDLLEELVYPLYSKWENSLKSKELTKEEAKESVKKFINKPSILRKVWKYVDDEE